MKLSLSDYLDRAEQAGLTWEQAGVLNDAEVEARLFKLIGRSEPSPRAAIDFKWVHAELGRVGVTLQLLWGDHQLAAQKAAVRPHHATRAVHVPVGALAPQPRHPRTDRRGQELPRQRARTRSHPPRLPRALCARTALARAARDRSSFSRLLGDSGRIAKIDVLILDDFLLAPMTDIERRDLLEVLEDRYGKHSTVLTSQPPTKSWHESLGDPTIGDAICDRLVHNAHVLTLRGSSMRRQKGLKPQPDPQPAA